MPIAWLKPYWQTPVRLTLSRHVLALDLHVYLLLLIFIDGGGKH